MTLIVDILAMVVGKGPELPLRNQDIRDLLAIGSDRYNSNFGTILDIYHTLPLVDYGSTKEGDELSAALVGHPETPGSSKFDQWYNSTNPDGKKVIKRREGSMAMRSLESTEVFGAPNCPQIVYNYYENGTWPGTRLAVMIVDTLRDGQEYGTSMKNVRYAIQATCSDWDQEQGLHRDLTVFKLYVDGQYLPMTAQNLAAANGYAQRLYEQIASGNEANYDPQAARAAIEAEHGENIFKATVWQARRDRALRAA